MISLTLRLMSSWSLVTTYPVSSSCRTLAFPKRQSSYLICSCSSALKKLLRSVVFGLALKTDYVWSSAQHCLDKFRAFSGFFLTPDLIVSQKTRSMYWLVMRPALSFVLSFNSCVRLYNVPSSILLLLNRIWDSRAVLVNSSVSLCYRDPPGAVALGDLCCYIDCKSLLLGCCCVQVRFFIASFLWCCFERGMRTIGLRKA